MKWLNPKCDSIRDQIKLYSLQVKWSNKNGFHVNCYSLSISSRANLRNEIQAIKIVSI